MNKQIDEIFKDLCNAPTGRVNDDFTIGILKESHTDLFIRIIAKHLASLHYRKQSEGKWVDAAIKQIIRKKAEVSEYWQNDVKQYRATQGYSDIEHDVDNFLRGYGEAIEDIIQILDGAKMKGGAE